jgi:hypothetical protein
MTDGGRPQRQPATIERTHEVFWGDTRKEPLNEKSLLLSWNDERSMRRAYDTPHPSIEMDDERPRRPTVRPSRFVDGHRKSPIGHRRRIIGVDPSPAPITPHRPTSDNAERDGKSAARADGLLCDEQRSASIHPEGIK